MSSSHPTDNQPMPDLSIVESDRAHSVYWPVDPSPEGALGNTARSGSAAENMPVYDSAEPAGSPSFDLNFFLTCAASLALGPFVEPRHREPTQLGTARTRKRAAERKKAKQGRR
jgi:hypothetical protein